MRSSTELLPQDEYTYDPEELISPAPETVTGQLLVESIQDETALLDKAVSIRDALDDELASMYDRLTKRYRSMTGYSLRAIESDLRNLKDGIAKTPDKGWVSVCRDQGLKQPILRLNSGWLHDIARNMVRNRPVEVEVSSITPNRFADKLLLPVSYRDAIEQQESGLAIGALLRRIQGLDYVRPVAVVDDLSLPAFVGTPEENRMAATRQAYELLREHKNIGLNDIPGKDFLILAHSGYADRYDEFVDRLEEAEPGFIAHYSDGRAYLRPTERIQESVAHQYSHPNSKLVREGILLRNTDGKPSDAVLQASTFLDKVNSQFTHLRLHSRDLQSIIGSYIHPVEQEQEVSMLLQALDISHPDRDHNVYYDFRRGSEYVAIAFASLLRREVQNIVSSLQSLKAVETAMKPADYFDHNYNDEEAGIWPEDQQGVTALSAELPLHYRPGDIESAAVIGYGPFSYPALAIAAFVKEGGVIDISDILPTNVAFAQEWFDGTAGKAHKDTYTRFANQLRLGRRTGKFYEGCEQRLQEIGRVHVAAFEDIPSDSAQVVAESFVSCSYNIEKYGFYEAIRQKARIMTWTPHSMMISVHMVESGGWNNSGDDEGITIPAARLPKGELEDGYRSAGLRVVKSVPLHADSAFREDYKGMLLVFAKPDTVEKPASIPR